MTIPVRIKVVAIAASIVSVFAAGLATGWYLYRPIVTQETYKPAVVQRDGSVVLERKPNVVPDVPKPVLPKGKHERTVIVTVKPKPQPKQEPVKPIDGFCPVSKDCPALTVRLDLVNQDDGRRVIASSPDGEIVGGLDIPIEKWVKRNENVWAIGATYDNGKRVGGFIDRDLGPLRVGLEADRDGVRVRAGIRF